MSTTKLVIENETLRRVAPTDQVDANTYTLHPLFGAKTQLKLPREGALISIISLTITGPSKHATGITITTSN